MKRMVPCSIWMPPAASGPVFTVSRPILTGLFWATALGDELRVERAQIVEAGNGERDLLDQVRVLGRGPPAHQGDLVIDGVRVGAQEDDARAPVLLGDREPQRVAIEGDHPLQVAY